MPHAYASGFPSPCVLLSDFLTSVVQDPFVIRRAQTTAAETHIVTMAIAGDRPPRYGEKTPPLTVGRGTGPRHASCYGKTSLRSYGPKKHNLTIDNAGETLSDARMASEGPRATGKSSPEVSPTGKKWRYETPSLTRQSRFRY